MNNLTADCSDCPRKFATLDIIKFGAYVGIRKRLTAFPPGLPSARRARQGLHPPHGPGASKGGLCAGVGVGVVETFDRVLISGMAPDASFFCFPFISKTWD